MSIIIREGNGMEGDIKLMEGTAAWERMILRRKGREGQGSK